MKTITFYSYKGGVGRSLLLANLAQRLVEFGKSVCMLDFDLEAPGLPFKYGGMKLFQDTTKGIVDFVTEYRRSIEGMPPQTLDDSYAILLNPEYQNQGSLHLITAGNTSKEDYWKNLADIDWKEMFYTPHGQGYQLILHLKALIEKELKPDYLFIDSRTGISETSSFALSILADRVVVVAANNDENIYGSKLIMRALQNTSFEQQKPEMHFILSRVPFDQTPDDRGRERNRINEIVKQFSDVGISVASLSFLLLHSDRGLEEKESLKINSFKRSGTSYIGEDYRLIFQQVIAPDFDLYPELKIKNENHALADKYYSDFNHESDFEKKLELISSCIQLHPTAFYYFERARLKEYHKQDHNAVIQDYEKAIEMEPDELQYYMSYGIYLKYSGKKKEGLELMNRALRVLPDNKILQAFKNSFSDKTINVNDEKQLIDAISGEENFYLFYRLAVYYLDIFYETRDKNHEDLVRKAANQAYNINSSDGEVILIYSKLHWLNEAPENFYLTLERALQLDRLSHTHPLRKSIPNDEFFRPLYNEEAFQRILYKYNIRLKTEG